MNRMMLSAVAAAVALACALAVTGASASVDSAGIEEALRTIEDGDTPSKPKPKALYGTWFTSKGKFEVQFFPEAAPKTVANFIKLIKIGWFVESYFYRFVANFVVQGGGYYQNRTSNSTVPLEYKLPNAKWTLGLARAEAPNSGSSEYYFNVANNSAILAPGPGSAGYCVFGKVISGFDTIGKLMQIPTHYSSGDGTDEFDQPWPRVHRIEVRQA